jgi:sugar lactone lactonase YvrE
MECASEITVAGVFRIMAIGNRVSVSVRSGLAVLVTRSIGAFAVIAAFLGLSQVGTAADFVYVSNPDQLRIDKFDMSGGFVSSITMADFGPYGLATDSAGNLYASRLNNTIVKFDPNGAVIGQISTGLNSPYFLAVDASDRLYASNFGGSNITVYDTSGSLVQTISSNLNLPYGIDFAANGDLLAANFGTGTVSRYNASGVYQSNFALEFGKNPIGLAVNSTGSIFVANFYASEVSVYDSAGSLQSTFTTNLSTPKALGVDSSDNLYVVNQASSSVSKFNSALVYQPGFAPSGLSGPFGIAFAVPEPSTYAMGMVVTVLCLFLARRSASRKLS